MKVSHYTFKPPWWATALTILLAILFLRLSVWQYHRYEFKKENQILYAAALTASPTHLTNASEQKSEHLFVRVFATGSYDPHQFLLDNRTQKGKIGFDVITPFKLENGKTILINRGFVPANIQREMTESITAPTGKIQLIGFLTNPEKDFVIGPIIEPQQKNWPLKIMRVAPETLSKPLGYAIEPNIILLDATAPNGFSREWSPPNLSAERSLGYCFQWFAFAITVLIIYIVINLKRR